MTGCFLVSLSLAAFAFSLASPVALPDSPASPPDSACCQCLGFPLHLTQEGEYARAAQELEGVSKDCDSDWEVAASRILRAECFAGTGDYAQAIALLTTCAEDGPPELSPIAAVRASEICLASGELDRASEVLTKFRACWQESDLRDSAETLYAYTLFKKRQFSDARDLLLIVSARTGDASLKCLCEELAASCLQCLGTAGVDKGQTTALSAIIPGAGQYYAGYRSDGKVALSTILLYALLAKDAKRTGHTNTSRILTAWTSGLYLGNVYGGRRAAIRRREGDLDQCISSPVALADAFFANTPPADLRWMREASPHIPPSCSPDLIWHRSVGSFRTRCYTRAGTELRRLLYLFPSSSEARQARLLLPLCTCGEGKFVEAASQWEKACGSARDPMLAGIPDVGMALCSFYAEDYQVAVDGLGQLRDKPLPSNMRDLCGYLTVWSYLGIDDPDKADTELGRLLESADSPIVMKNAIALRAAMAATPRPRILSERKAVRLSRIIPGAGQIYAGDIRNGLTSFALNLALAGKAEQWWESDFKLGAVFIGWQGCLRFYRGNLYNARRLVREKNTRRRDVYFQHLEKSQDLDPVQYLGEGLLRTGWQR